MPEGDSIVGAARRLGAVLTGHSLVRVELRRHGTGPRPGVRVESVDAHGKHLLIRFDDGTALRTHLRMNGRWDVYQPGERWRRPAFRARVVLETDEHVTAVCFDAPEVEMLRNERDERDRLGHLGPDLCRPDVDVATIVERVQRVDPGTEIGVALLDQRVACGVGNVYKSEVCFACRVNPFTTIATLDEATVTALFTTAARLLAANLGPGRRTTFAGGYAVYRRARRPCPRCGTLVLMRRQGEQARSSYWCPRCQPATTS
jgi:endonuclease-8